MAAPAPAADAGSRGDVAVSRGTVLRILAIGACVAVFVVHTALYPPPNSSLRALAHSARIAGSLQVLGIALLAVLAAARFSGPHDRSRPATLAAAALLGVALGYATIVEPSELIAIWHEHPLRFWTEPAQYLGVAWVGVALLVLYERDRAAARALYVEQERQFDLERQASEARLQVLRSQVEPHFLFNTLAHLRRLYATDAAAGREMSTNLARYLSATTPALQRDGLPLGDDLDLALAYLELQKVRMGSRLVVDVAVPESARTAQVPPLTITTLVENAIKHGLSVLPAGGRIDIRARTDATWVTLEVADTGRGLVADLGTGVGLANLRARLAHLHGPAAVLSLRSASPSGVVATVVVPRARCAETAA